MEFDSETDRPHLTYSIFERSKEIMTIRTTSAVWHHFLDFLVEDKPVRLTGVSGLLNRFLSQPVSMHQ